MECKGRNRMYFKAILCLLVIYTVILAAMVYKSTRYMDIGTHIHSGTFNNRNNTTGDGEKMKLHVLIFASKRTGSSFLGEYFNQNPRFFYSREPLKTMTQMALQKKISDALFDTLSVDVVSKFFHCDFSEAHPWFSLLTPGCPYSIALNDTSICHRTGILKNVPLSKQNVTDILTPSCQGRDHIAIKVIRMYDLNLLRSFALDPTLNIKIIHLVRDPRAVFQSRNTINEHNEDFARRKVIVDEVTDYCRNLAKNLAIARSGLLGLEGKYKLVRYEDLATRPVEMMKDMYDFLRLSYSPEVETWLQKNTVINTGDPFLTSKNAKFVLKKWRHAMPWNKVRDIQNKCTVAMDLLHYHLLKNDKDLRKDSIPTFH
ncbi:carbohydrate sulfotransferase 3-like [Glandiceps talaboti]